MIRKCTIAFILCVIGFGAGSSHAVNNAISCTGTIATVGVHGTDRVMLRLSSMNTIVQICHLGQTLGTHYAITPEQCKLAYSTLLAAYAMGKTINVYFDNVENGSSCSTFKSWEVATARWVHLDG
ncbi:MAG: hypothetical protein MK096_15035 [Oleiphilaceae bacterium]|nr:hypothetical protein [Oleiphilaceae bacterium]